MGVDFLVGYQESITIITIITVIVPPLTNPGAERFLSFLAVDIAQGAELPALFLPFSSH